MNSDHLRRLLLYAVIPIAALQVFATVPARALAPVGRVTAAHGCAVDSTVAAGPGVIITDHGAVQGVPIGAGSVYAFKGIPYAAPPVGALRWQPPADAACWTGVRDASLFGSSCTQLGRNGVEGNEDCLTLSVWTPAAQQSAPAPVMVFIHGGGNQTGSSALPTYDGAALAARENAVVVTINYRLGALGFLAAPAFDAESVSGVSGNYGILDQIAALGWVQRNIAAFNGDAARVLIFGESAGGVDVCVLVASPLAAGLFSRAIIESGGCTQPSLSTVEGTGSRFVAAAGCADAADIAACLRSLSAADAVNALPAGVSVADPRTNLWHPAVDGYVLPATPLDVIASGNHNHVPIIIGANADETGAYVPAGIRTEQDYEQAVYQVAGMRAGALILAEYPAAAFPSPRLAYVAATTDAFFVCPSRAMARAAATGQQEPVYRYLFTHTASGRAAALGAYHGLELAYVFGTLPAQSASDIAVSNAVMDYWGRFAASGDPNAAGAVAWPRYDVTADPYLGISDPPVAGAGVRTDRCDFWNRLTAAPVI